MTATTTEIRELLAEALETLADEYGLDLSTSSFAENELLTTDEGLVVELGESEFQLTIVQSA